MNRPYYILLKIQGGYAMLELEQYKYGLSEIAEAIREIEVSL